MKNNTVRKWDLFRTFFRLGLFTFGGGYAMLGNIREVVLERKKWLTEEELLQVITIAESTPGPIAVNLSTYVGYQKGGVGGSIAATTGVILPSFVIILLISFFLDAFMANRYVAAAFVGIKSAVVFLILRAGWQMLTKLSKKPLPLTVFGLVIVGMLLLSALSISFSSIPLLLAGGLLTLVIDGIQSRKGDQRS